MGRYGSPACYVGPWWHPSLDCCQGSYLSPWLCWSCGLCGCLWLLLPQNQEDRTAQSWPIPSPAAALQRDGLVPHLGSTVEMTLLGRTSSKPVHGTREDREGELALTLIHVVVWTGRDEFLTTIITGRRTGHEATRVG